MYSSEAEGISQAEAMPNSKKIKPAALGITLV